MRLAFFVLLLVNALVFAYFLWQPGSGGASPRPALRPEAIRIVASGVAPSPPAQDRCFEWSGIGAADLEGARKALEAAGFGKQLVVAAATEYWVHIPPLKNRAEAEKKLAELKALGVDTGSLVEAEGDLRHAIGLGSFASAAEAEASLRQLRDKGVKSAKVMERQAAPSSLTVIRVTPEQQTKLEEAHAAFGKGSLTPVECRLP